MQFDFRHIAIMVIILAIGVFIGAKKPSLVSTVTGGMVSA